MSVLTTNQGLIHNIDLDRMEFWHAGQLIGLYDLTGFNMRNVVNSPSRDLFVDGANGSDSNDGLLWTNAKATLAAAITAAAAKERIYIAQGTYTEEITVPVAKSNLSLIGMGARGSILVQGAGATTILTNNANRTTLRNITLIGDETGGSVGLLNRGRGLRYLTGRILNVTTSAKFTLGTPTEVTAGTFGDGSDTLCEDVEFSWGTDGVELIGVQDLVDPGDFPTTQNYFRRCFFHNLSNSSFKETPAGAAAQSFRDLEVADCIFRRNEAGVEPTAYILLNGDNANSGIVTRCSFPTALTGGKNLVSTAVIWVSNYHTGGVSGAVPS